MSSQQGNFKDMNGEVVAIDDHVIVPEPIDGDDLWNCSFKGMVVDIDYDLEIITVEDNDGFTFDVDPERLIVL